LHDRDIPKGTFTRVGDHKSSDGHRIVFFTVEAQGQSVGYIVYLNPQGQVEKVE
jgi:hypothetical protein